MAIFSSVLFLLAASSHALPSSNLVERQQNAPAIRKVAQSEWDSLRNSVGGRLYDGRPKNLPCYWNYNNGQSGNGQWPDGNKCTQIQQNRNNPNYIADSFGGYQLLNFGSCMGNGQNCALSNSQTDFSSGLGTCYQGSVPDRYIDVREVGDIQKGLAFASKNKIPLVIKNTGHDYKGRSSGQYTFALWTHNYRPQMRLDEQFNPEGCSAQAGPAVTYGAGEMFGPIASFAHDKGYTIVSGAASTVGASGGWISGGGHGALSNTLGLGVDNALQLKAVLPNGTYVTANRCQNQDIFFALRGGGGGTFGVITETTSKVYKEFPVQVVNVVFRRGGQTDFNKIMIENAVKWAADGWGGYAVQQGDLKGLTAVSPKMKSPDEAKASLKAMIDYSTAQGSQQVFFESKTSNSFYDYFKSDAQGGLLGAYGNGISIAASSRLVPREMFNSTDNQQKLLKVLNGQNYALQLVTPASYALPDSDKVGGPGESSVSPAWRDALWHVTLSQNWDGSNQNDNNPNTVTSRFKAVRDAAQPLRDLTPNSGAYLNEADVFEPDMVKTFWGQKNYDRLLNIKKQVDPNNILTCHQCIGWNPSDSRYSCYPKL